MSGRRLTKYKKHNNHIVHAAGHDQTHVLHKKHLNKKAALAGLLCLIVLLGVGVIVFIRIQNNTQADQTVNEESEKAALIEQVKTVQAGTSAVEQQELIDRIASTRNYESDRDLLYLLVVHYVRQTNSVEARKYFTKLQQVYDETKTFSSTLGITKSMSVLESDVRFIELQAERFKESSKNGLVSQ